MQESSVYQHLVETMGEKRYQQGIEQGARQSTMRDLFAVLEFRFDGRAVQALRPALESIQDLQRLQALHHEALSTESLETFVYTLGTNANEN